MPITFDCPCGRNFSVGDEFAGKRTKCPSCGGRLTVPAPEVSPTAGEDEAYRALMESPDPDPDPSSARSPVWTGPTHEPNEPERSKPAASKIPARRGRRPVASAPRSDEYGREPRRPAIHISSGVLGGLGMMVLAVVWFGLGWAAGRIYFYPPVLFVFGLVAVVRGLLGHSED